MLELNPDLNTSQQTNQSDKVSETLLEPTKMSAAEYESDDGIELVDYNEDDCKGVDDDTTSTYDVQFPFVFRSRWG